MSRATRTAERHQQRLAEITATEAHGRPLSEWACDADDWTAGRTRIREQLLIDHTTSQPQLARTVLR